MGLSPTQRTLRHLEQRGCICGIVERFIPFAGKFGRRIDLFNFIDIISVEADRITAIQSCGQSFSEHKKKILENEVAPEWLKAGGGIELYSWRKVKLRRGAKAMRWQPRIYVFTLGDFD